MASTTISSAVAKLTSPKDALLTPLLADPLTADQWNTLLAIADAVIPSIQRPRNATGPAQTRVLSDEEYNETLLDIQADSHDKSQAVVESYLSESASSCPAFRQITHRLFSAGMATEFRNQLLLILNLLNTRAGSLFFTGYITPFAQQPIHIREQILSGWATARLPSLRQLQRALTTLVKQVWIRSSLSLPTVLGIGRTPTDWRIGEGFQYNFVQIPPGDNPEVLETDIVIVGSGCGAGVCAKNLSEAGHRVLVVEKGYHWPAEYFPMTEEAGLVHLFMNNGAPIVSDDSSMVVFCGQTWGGGGSVNWSASLQTQGFVREEWASNGLPFFTSPEYQASMDRVCKRMGVSADYIVPNKTNEHLLEGARRLGWTHKLVPQNTAGSAHSCGYCTLGCASCDKQGPANSFLPDASRAGARFVEGLDVHEVLFANDKQGGERVAVGVRGTWTSRDAQLGVSDPATQNRREVIVRAKRVIVSCGTLSSPLLLMRSGLKNPHIGRNLYLHPVQILGATYDEETVPWEGGILTSVVTEFENLDHRGHGVKLEATCMLPGFFLPLLPWPSAADGAGMRYKAIAAKLRHMAGYIAIARDEHTGRVYPDPVDGRTRISYCTSKTDRANILTGIQALARICHTTGAKQIIAGTPGVPTYNRPAAPAASDPSDPASFAPDAEFTSFLESVRRRGLPHPDVAFPSAHQMGTCRMAAKARDGVVDPHGQVWGVKGLYVADASVFPSASGVNPMVSVMATADWISQWVGRDLSGTGVETARL
jgi:choline dehydrogenase-like flavoprotein